MACGEEYDKLGSSDNSSGGRAELQLGVSPMEQQARAIILKAAKERSEHEELRSKAHKAMQQYLFDPSSAQYLSLRAGRDGAVCGKVNAKNRYGAYVGFKDFVVQRSGNLEISESNNGLAGEPYGPFANAYLAGCASQTEKKKYRADTSAIENLTAENLVVEDDLYEDASGDPFAD